MAVPRNREAVCNGGASSWLDRPEDKFVQPDTWSDASYRDREQDMQAAIQALKADPVWRRAIDWQRLGLAGHSLGGYTVLGLGGAWPSWKLDNVKGILALSPYDQPYLAKGTLKYLSAPVMFQGGTLDLGITPSVAKNEGGYEEAPPPKYFVDLDHATHFAWTDIGRIGHDAIVRYAIAFMNHYVKDEVADPVLTQPMPGVAALRVRSDVGNVDFSSSQNESQRGP
jgi:predicted dienelactone hydrolase